MKALSGINFISKVNKAVKMELREHRSSFFVYFLLRLMVIIVMARQIYNSNYESVFLCALTLLLLIIPSLLQVTLKVELPTILEIFIMLFIFAAEILGEINEFYIIIPFWDTLLHTINGFLAAAIGFSLMDLLSRNDKLLFQLSPLFMAIVSFSFSMTIGVIWELFEFGMDVVFDFDMQKDTVIHSISSVLLDPQESNTVMHVKNISNVLVNGKKLGINGYLDIGLIDTMEDLLVNIIGALIFSVFGYLYVKNKGRIRIIGGFIPRKKKKEKDFLQVAESEENKHKRNTVRHNK